MNSNLTGYSGTPLAKKLGVVDGSRVAVKNAPENYAQLLEPIPAGITFEEKVSQFTDIIHVFCDRKSSLKMELTEDTIRELALPLGFVDIKVCAVSEVWSGLKLVIRKELRCTA